MSFKSDSDADRRALPIVPALTVLAVTGITLAAISLMAKRGALREGANADHLIKKCDRALCLLDERLAGIG